MVWDWLPSYLPLLLNGLRITLELLVLSVVIGMALAIPIGLVQALRTPVLGAMAGAFCTFIRGTPLLVQLIIIYTGLPQLGLPRLDVLQSALLGLVLNEAAYLSEILRGGILSVPTGQKDAALALGLSRSKAFVLVTMPQAMRAPS